MGLVRKGLTLPLASGVASNAFATLFSTNKISAYQAMQLNKGWVYACVRAIAEGLAGLRFRLFQTAKDGTVEEIFEHELLDLLHSVNQFQTEYDLKYLTGSHLELTGSSYWLLDGVKNEMSKPTAIFPLNPKYVKVLKAPLPQFISGYEYTVDTTTKTLKPYEVLHIKYPNPDDIYEGRGTVEAIYDWIMADYYSTMVNAKYFKNGAKLGHILKPKTALQPSQIKSLRESFEALQSGAENSYRPFVLPCDIDVEKESDNPKDMDFANLQKVSQDKILAGFRVPKTVLGSAESETNRSTAETANYVFSKRTLWPKCELISQYLNEFLVPRYGDNLYLEFENPVPEDKAAELEEMKAATGLQPVMSINEAREEYLGLGPVENGESVMGSAMMSVIGAPVKESKAVRRTGTKKPSIRFTKNAQNRKKISEDIAEKTVQLIAAGEKKLAEAKQKAIKDISKMSDEDFEPIHKAFIGRVSPYEKKLAKVVRGFNKDQKKEVVANIKKLAKGVKINKTDIFDKKKWINVLIDLSTPGLLELFKKEGEEAMSLMGAQGFTISKESKNAVELAIELLSRSYNDTTLDALKTVLEEGQAEGLGLDELASKIDDVYEYSDITRAETVARTETFRIANEATRTAWKETGVVKTIKWFTAADERVCDWCGPMHGKTVGIDDSFFKKGDSVTGTSGQEMSLDYSDVDAPPLHANCRCYTRPDEIEVNFDEGKGQENDDGELDDILNVLKEQ